MNSQVNSDRLHNLEQRITELEHRLAALESKSAVANLVGGDAGVSGPPEKKLSIKEFVNNFVPKNTRETTLAIAYYLENDGTTPFNVQDLEQGFRAGKIPLPKNINDMVNKNIQQGLLMEAAENKDSRKAWELTATGERTIQDRVEKG